MRSGKLGLLGKRKDGSLASERRMKQDRNEDLGSLNISIDLKADRRATRNRDSKSKKIGKYPQVSLERADR